MKCRIRKANRKVFDLFDLFFAATCRNQGDILSHCSKVAVSIVHVDGIGSKARRTCSTEDVTFKRHRLTAVPAAGDIPRALYYGDCHIIRLWRRAK